MGFSRFLYPFYHKKGSGKINSTLTKWKDRVVANCHLFSQPVSANEFSTVGLVEDDSGGSLFTYTDSGLCCTTAVS